MSIENGNSDEQRFGSLTDIPPPTTKRPRLLKPAIIVLAVATLLLFLLRPETHRLDVYRTLSELDIPDAALAACIRTTAEANEWPDAGHFTSLHCNNPDGEGIERLDGLEHFVVLRELNLAFNRISDASAVAGLPHLVSLDMSHNRLEALPALVSAANLKTLELNYNRIASLDWMAAHYFPELERIELAHNGLVSLDGLPELPALRELVVRNNRIAQVGDLSGYAELHMLDLGGNRIDELSGIAGLQGLRRLFIDRNSLTSLDGLAGLQNLEVLDTSFNRVESIEVLSTLYGLRRLSLRDTGIPDLDGILALGDVEMLDISGNPDLGCDAVATAIAEYGATAVHADARCGAGDPDAP